jgi:protein SCO1/2
MLPDFALIDHHGRPVSRATWAGSVWIADFIFTRCAGQCPLMSAQMASLRAALREVPRVQFVSFSVDPAHDTPARLASYARAYGADDDGWRFVTQPPAPAGAVAAEEPIGSVERLARASVRFALVDARGAIRGTYEATDAQAMARLQADARRLAQE